VTGDLARVVTAEDVRRSVDRARKSLADAALEVVWQIENEVWHVAGYDSWDAMREAEYGGAAFIVPRDERRELVSRLRDAGLTQREVAATAGVTKRTVQRDEATNVATTDDPLGRFENECYIDPSGGARDLKAILRNTDRFLNNYYVEPAPHLIDVLEAWLDRHARKVHRARKEIDRNGQ
jgi:transcriptional regulator with XRE-family HTH domain